VLLSNKREVTSAAVDDRIAVAQEG
jgi:hypothetical protein